MRISTNPRDPGFSEGRQYIVLFNGREESPENTGRSVYTADEDRGMIAFVTWNDEISAFQEGKLFGHVRLNRVFSWTEATGRKT